MDEKLKSVELEKIKLPKIKGHTTIELTDVNTGKVERIESDNMVTTAVEEFLTFWMRFKSLRELKTWMFPLYTGAMGGLYLFDETIPTTQKFFPSLDDAELIGHAGQRISDGDEPRRGNYNATESGPVTNGYKLVWDFGTDVANGVIKSACLTQRSAGYLGYDFDPAQLPSGRQDYSHGTLNYVHGETDFYTNQIGFNNVWAGRIVDWSDNGSEIDFETIYTNPANYYNASTSGGLFNNVQIIRRHYKFRYQNLKLVSLDTVNVTLVSEEIFSNISAFPGEIYNPSDRNGYVDNAIHIFVKMANGYVGFLNFTNKSNLNNYKYYLAVIYDNQFNVIRTIRSEDFDSTNLSNWTSFVSAGSKYSAVVDDNYRAGTTRLIGNKLFGITYDNSNNHSNAKLCSLNISTGQIVIEDSNIVPSLNAYYYQNQGDNVKASSQYLSFSDIMYLNNDIMFGRWLISKSGNKKLFRERGHSWYAFTSSNYGFSPMGFDFMYMTAANDASRIVPNLQYLATINNLSTPIVKTSDKTMKVTYTLTEAT